MRANWGENYRIGSVPAYAELENYDADAIGYPFRTIQSLSTDVDASFDESVLAQYQILNIKYMILPAYQQTARARDDDRDTRSPHAVRGRYVGLLPSRRRAGFDRRRPHRHRPRVVAVPLLGSRDPQRVSVGRVQRRYAGRVRPSRAILRPVAPGQILQQSNDAVDGSYSANVSLATAGGRAAQGVVRPALDGHRRRRGGEAGDDGAELRGRRGERRRAT